MASHRIAEIENRRNGNYDVFVYGPKLGLLARKRNVNATEAVEFTRTYDVPGFAVRFPLGWGMR